MKHTLLLPILLCFSFAALAQDTLTLYFRRSLLPQCRENAVFPVWPCHIGKRGYIHPRTARRDIPFVYCRPVSRQLWAFPRRLHLPDSLKGDSSVGYFTLFSHTAPEARLPHTLVVAVCGMGTGQLTLFPDRNGNLDLRDDGPGISLSGGRGSLMLASPAGGPGTGVRLWCGNPAAMAHARVADSLERAGKMPRRAWWGPHPDRPFPLSLSFSVVYLNIRELDTLIQGIPCRMQLQDGDCSGRFTDAPSGPTPDLLRVPDPVTGAYEPFLGGQSVPALPGQVIHLPAGNLRVVAVDPAGDWVKLVPSDQRPDLLLKGDPLPEVFLESLTDGAEIPLDRMRDTTRYTLMDFWGTWCAPCRQATPELRRLDSLYRGQLKIIGVVNEGPEQLVPYLRSNGILWEQYRMSFQAQKVLGITAWPTYLLLAPDGTVIFPRCRLEQIEALLRSLPAPPPAGMQ